MKNSIVKKFLSMALAVGMVGSMGGNAFASDESSESYLCESDASGQSNLYIERYSSINYAENISENKTIGTSRVLPIEYCKKCDTFDKPIISNLTEISSDCIYITYRVTKHCANEDCKYSLGVGTMTVVRQKEAHNYTWKSLGCSGRSHYYAYTCTKCNVQEQSLTVSCNGNCVLPMKVE